jgi:alkyldihydroxyacetonephosphate synthase
VTIALDIESLLVDVSGDETLADVEAALKRQRLTLDVDPSSHAMTVREWIEAGAPGARDAWLDPADQILAGLDALLPSGKKLVIHPAPRRAVGPDLTALVVGCGGRYAKLVRAHLRVHKGDVTRPKTAPFARDRNPDMTEGETALLAALDRELKSL